MTVRQSRLSLATAAIRPSMKGRVMLSGPSGAGKTYSALLIAETLAGPGGRVLLVDTEKESSLTYADVFTFEHLRWNAPFDPTELAATVMDAGASYDVIIIDSFSHFWRKQGGILDIAAGKFTGWKDARPLQESVLEAILETDAHVIACCRSKMEHVQERDEATGKQVVRKLGIKAQQDDDFEYEVNVSLEVDMQHALAVSKSRTNAVPVGRTFTPGQAADFATIYRDWLAGGEDVAPRQGTDALAATLNGISDEGERRKAKHMFMDAFGRPEFLLASKLAEAQAWVADRAAGVALPANRAEAQEPPDAQVSDPAVAPATGGPSSASSTPAGEPSVTSESETALVAASGEEPNGSVAAEGGTGVLVGAPGATSAATSPPGNVAAPVPAHAVGDPDGSEPPPDPDTQQVPTPARESTGVRPAAVPKPSTPQQRQRIAMRCAEIAEHGLLAQGDKAEIVGVITHSRATSTTEITEAEASKMLSLLAFLEAGDVCMVTDPADETARAIQATTQRGADFLKPIIDGAP